MTHRIQFAGLDRKLIALYTGKWFLIWSIKLFLLALVAICAITGFFISAMGNGNRKD